MNAMQELWDKIRALFEPILSRSIKDVDSWDGSASNYADTNAYCAACLIDVNGAAGRNEKAQSHCMLPVRGPGDGADTYVRQAVYAAAGGHGISQVKKPEDVPEDDWNAAVKAAANKLITAYGQMDVQAPDAVYNLAGKEPPEEKRDMSSKQRAISLADVYHQVAVGLYGDGEDPSAAYLMDLFVDDGQIVAIANRGGKLMRGVVAVEGDTAKLGSLESVEMIFTSTMRSRFMVTREANGQTRWFALVATNVLNRVGEIDSAALFKDFVRRFTDDPAARPVLLDFYHQSNLIMGEATWLAADDHLLVASGTFYDNELARAFVDASLAGRGAWGNSIGYLPMHEPRSMEVLPGVTIPVYEAGVLRKIAVLPEEKAASWFTTIGVEVERDMEQNVKDALYQLFGPDKKAQADQFIAGLEQTNRSITEQGLVTRQALTEDKVREIAEAAVAKVPAVDLKPLTDAVALLTEQNTKLVERLQALETAEQQRRVDMPERGQANPTYRPRDQRGSGEPSFAELADATLNQMQTRPAGGK